MTTWICERFLNLLIVDAVTEVFVPIAVVPVELHVAL